MNCQMDDVAWWSRALSYTEVQALQSGAVPAPTVMVFPPAIVSQPASVPNAYVGDNDTFAVPSNRHVSPHLPVVLHQLRRDHGD